MVSLKLGDPILVITGPTASGKTRDALALARADPKIEIVSADASLVYRGFDIGTAKPSKEILAEIPHHLIDILEPSEQFSAADYSTRTRKVIREIISRGKAPIVVGGTGLYIDALFDGLVQFDISTEELTEAKRRAKREIAEEGFDAMHDRLREIDPELYVQIRRERNPIRLERAWTHYYATGEPLGEARKRIPEPFEFRPEYHVLTVPRPELWRRIEMRVDEMLARGWLEEVESLIQQGVTRSAPAMRAHGYRELFDVIERKLSLDAARESIIIQTRQYAKRQATWMKKYELAH
ncbi:MAG TPA: tRNA (adenosine(37)-N6)-dimethylallyltransferase MiaA [Candidatus Kapabacteria bacterium]|nr:tRNA (adenosine(37)-N6)-dimethylallyltransferase MiaA [Candidatus Kapabacteria bacterium]